MKLTLLIVVIVLALWSIYGYFASRVEQAEYSVLKKEGVYEIRNYPSHIVAQTTVSGSYNDATSEGFTIVAGYIFGGNTKKESIAMTAPVTIKAEISEKIAMTAPVVIREEGDSRVVSFGIPKSYTLKTLPVPTDPRVKLVEVPEKKFAVLQFSGYRTDERIKRTEKKLLEALASDAVATVGTPFYAGYNAPGTPPWMTKNEVLIEIK